MLFEGKSAQMKCSYRLFTFSLPALCCKVFNILLLLSLTVLLFH